MIEFVTYIFNYLFSFLKFDICLWILGAAALFSIITIVYFIIKGSKSW